MGVVLRPFKREAFDRMIFNPHNLDHDTIESEVRTGILNEALGETIWKYPKIYRVKAIVYLLFLYDKGTGLIKIYPNITDRKEICAQLAGFTLDKPNEKERAESLYKLENDHLRMAVISFIRFQNDITWGLYVSSTEHMWKLLQAVDKRFEEFRDPKQELDASVVKTKLLEQVDEWRSRVKGYEHELFQGDDVLRDAVIKNRGTFSEDRAELNEVI